jgi:hypothetical protein
VGEKSIGAGRLDPAGSIADFCHEIEVYLCRKNDGHLIRVVGPSFDLVSGWAARGVPIKIAFEGIDRYFERYYRKGPRRRPVKIDFCEADVLDVFDEWRRATGITSPGSRIADAPTNPELPIPNPDRRSLPVHLQRIVTRLSSARAANTLGPELESIIDRVSAELDLARSAPGGLRGAARQAALSRLERIDADMLDAVRRTLDPPALAAISAEADEELRPFRSGMAPEAHARAHAAAVLRLIRQRFNLPTVLVA